MEPMTLGSPIVSPAASPLASPLNVGTGSAASTPYYPSYLIGDTQSPSINRITQAGGISPGRLPMKKCPQPHFSPGTSNLVRDRFFHSTRPIGDHNYGPPISPLIGGLPQSPGQKTAGTSFLDTSKLANTSLNSSIISSSVAFSNSCLAGNFDRTSDILVETEPELDGQNCWVTVFGFQYASASFVLTQFAQSGTIVEHYQPDVGNYMHIKFQSVMQARRALGRNGKVISANIMLGVVPCTDKSVLFAGDTSFGVRQSLNLNGNDSLQNTPKSHIRPLTQAYQSSRASMEVTPECKTPRKTEGMIAKAFNSILGL